MVEKYKTKFHCGEDQVTVAVCSDGTLELEGYDEEYDEAAQEFGYERSICGDIVRLWRDEDVASNKIFVVFSMMICNIDHAVQLTAELLEHAMHVLPKYKNIDPPLRGTHCAVLDVDMAISQISRTIELRQSGELIGPAHASLHSGFFYSIEQLESEFLLFTSRHRHELDLLKASEDDSSRPATTSFFEAAGYLCRGAKLLEDPQPNHPETVEAVLNDTFQSTNRALWSITLSKNKRRGSDFRDTVDWFIGRFVKFMKEHP